jgi:hypothetical protein
LALCQDLAVNQAAELLRCTDKHLWRRIKHYVDEARALDDMSAVKIVGIDETSLRRGQDYIVGPATLPFTQKGHLLDAHGGLVHAGHVTRRPFLVLTPTQNTID